MGVFDTIINWYNSVKALIAALPNALSAIWTFITNTWNELVSEVEDLYSYAYALAEYDINYAVNLYNSIVAWDTKALALVYQYIYSQIAAAIQRIQALEDWVDNLLGTLWNDIYAYIQQMLTWFYDTYVKPWVDMVEYVWDWVINNGAFILNLLTHPLLLAEIVGKYLLTAWEGLASEFAVPFFRWFYRNLISLSPLFAGLIEDVIAALFD